MSAVAERQAQRAWGGGYDAAKISARVLIYGALILWTIISLFPISIVRRNMRLSRW